MAQFGVDLKFTSAKAEQALKRVSGGVKKVSRDVERLQGRVGRDLDSSFKKVGSTGRSAIDGIGDAFSRASKKANQFGRDAKAAALKAERNFKRAAKSIGKSKGFRGAAAGAAFSNVPGSGFVGAAGAGGLVGGPLGAGIAVGVKALLDGGQAFAEYANNATKLAAEIKKLEISLRSVAGSGADVALERLNEINTRYNATNKETLKGFTQTLAGAKSANVPLEDALKTYEGLTVANKALGGSQDDLNGILRAATQIFSKNKVQAEELRGQIGDRLPGAFGQFAKAVGMSTQELDKAMTDGEITVEDFVKFATSYLGPNSEWEKAANKIAQSPSEAGARLEKRLETLATNVGRLLQPIGAAFQKVFGAIVFYINQGIEALNRFLGIGLDNALNKSIRVRNSKERSFKNIFPEMENFDTSSLNPRKRQQFDRLRGDFVNARAEADRLQNLKNTRNSAKPFESGATVSLVTSDDSSSSSASTAQYHKTSPTSDAKSDCVPGSCNLAA